MAGDGRRGPGLHSAVDGWMRAALVSWGRWWCRHAHRPLRPHAPRRHAAAPADQASCHRLLVALPSLGKHVTAGRDEARRLCRNEQILHITSQVEVREKYRRVKDEEVETEPRGR
ncbi:hypothetical protein E2C01_051329 [Portunus trituberculatus]|uniref:Uncharacterized protein n=1 Tax=Portunus trituberculatus TaxID=210409 RepID=A0A5B7GAP2_PORTR|nr:hypothetical protein [Portunus trituberculatus]